MFVYLCFNLLFLSFSFLELIKSMISVEHGKVYLMDFYRMTFLVAEACLIAGAKKNAYHTKYRDMIYARSFSCESLRKGIFIAGAVFVIATMVLNIYYYLYFSKATTQPAHKINRASSAAGKTGRV